MYIGSKSHGEKIYHNQFCTYVQRMKKVNRRAFYTEEEAREKGYRACNCCSTLGKRYHKERKAITAFTIKKHMKIWLENDVVYIETRIATWKICKQGKSKRILLYHANTENFSTCKKQKGKIIRTYHAQKSAWSSTIMGYLKYIDEHDTWRDSVADDYKKMPTTTKAQRKKYKEAKKQAQKRAARNVLNMIEALRVEREYKERQTHGII